MICKSLLNFKVLKLSMMVVILISSIFTKTVLGQTAVGDVLLATGAVSATSPDGSVRVLGKGSPVFAGDRITTAKKSLCVLLMVDEAKMTIKQDSELVIDQYQFEGAEDDSSVLELVKGGFRTVTGIIGSNNPDAYQVDSNLSVLGIRGTEFSKQICGKGDCFQIGGGEPEPGEYTTVHQGNVFVTTKANNCDTSCKVNCDSACTIELGVNMTGFVTPTTLQILPQEQSPVFAEPIPSPQSVDEDSPSVPAPQACEV